jgi:hypothetical protein
MDVENMETGSCEEMVFWGSWPGLICFATELELRLWGGHLTSLYAVQLAALSECCTQIGFAPYAEPPFQVVAEAGPSSFHRYLQANRSPRP